MITPFLCHKALALLCLIVLLLSPLPTPVLAEGAATQGADIVFLIDQSGSMQTSDPLGLRYSGLQYAVEWLGRTLLEYDPLHQKSFRVAVVDFGTYAKQVLDPIEIAPTSEDNWRDVSSFIEKRLAPENRQGLGTTEMIPAFEKANEVFSTWGAPVSERQRILILLTDGLPFPDPATAMQRVEAMYQATFPHPTYQLHVIGLSSPDSPWSLFANRWSALSHNQARAVENRRLLGTHFQRILGQVAQSLGIQGEQEVQCGMVAVSPYLDLMRITVHNPDPSVPVNVYDAENRLVNAAVVDGITQSDSQLIEVQGHGTAIEAITAFDPRPGNWRVECPSSGEARPSLFVRQVAAHSQVEMPGQHLALGVPYAVTFRIFDHAGKPLPPEKDPRYALDVRLSAAASEQTDDQTENVVLRFDSTSQAYQGTITPTKAGEWSHRLVARSATPDGREQIVADTTTPSVQVVQPQAVVSLPAGQVGQLQPVSLTLTLQDNAGYPFFKTTEILSALKAEATIVAATQTVTVPLTASDSGLFNGSFVPFASGDHDVQGHVYLLDPTQPQPREITDGSSTTRFVVQPVELESRIEPRLLTQLVPATIHLNSPADQVGILAPFQDLSLWTAQIAGLGSSDVDISKSMPTEDEIVLNLTPKIAGEFRPELSLSLMRPGASEPAGLIRQVLTPARVTPPQVITQTVEPETESTDCVLSAKLLDAAEQPFAEMMDPSYTLTVVAKGAPGSDTPDIPLELSADGIHRSTIKPSKNVSYFLTVEAQRNDETIQLVDGISLLSPECGVFAGTNRSWMVPLLAIAALLILLIALGIALWIRRRSQPDTDAVNNDAYGWVVLERPKGTPIVEHDLSETKRISQTWAPSDVTSAGKPMICPVGKVEIKQSIQESKGEGRTGTVGAHVQVFLQDGLDALDGEHWVDQGIGWELKDHWWITFRLKGMAPPAPVPVPSPSGRIDTPSVRSISVRPRPATDTARPSSGDFEITSSEQTAGKASAVSSTRDLVSAQSQVNSEASQSAPEPIVDTSTAPTADQKPAQSSAAARGSRRPRPSSDDLTAKRGG